LRRKKSKKFVPISEVIEGRFMGRLMSGLISEYKIIQSWDEIVGKTLSNKTQPGRIIRGILYINVASSVISNQLFFLKDEMINKINDHLGEKKVKDLKFRVRNLVSREEKELRI